MSVHPLAVRDADHLSSGARRIGERADHVHDRRHAELAPHRRRRAASPGASRGANMNTIPRVIEHARASPPARARSRRRAPRARRRCRSASVNERLPCFAMRTPAPAATSAAAVEMLNVVNAPPPVPQVSTSVAGSSDANATIARAQRARAARDLRRRLALHARAPTSSARDLRRRRLALHDHVERARRLVRGERFARRESADRFDERVRLDYRTPSGSTRLLGEPRV